MSRSACFGKEPKQALRFPGPSGSAPRLAPQQGSAAGARNEQESGSFWDAQTVQGSCSFAIMQFSNEIRVLLQFAVRGVPACEAAPARTHEKQKCSTPSAADMKRSSNVPSAYRC